MWDAWLNAGCAENWSQGWERQCLPSPLGCADGAGAQDTPSQPELCTPQRRPQNGAGGGWGSDRVGEGGRGSARAPPAGRGRTLPLPSDKRPRRPLPRTAHALTSTGERARGGGFTSRAAHALCRCAPPPSARRRFRSSRAPPAPPRPPPRPARAAAVTRRPAPVRTPLQRQVGARPPAGGRGACGRVAVRPDSPSPQSIGTASCFAESVKRGGEEKIKNKKSKPDSFSPQKIAAEVCHPRCRFARGAASAARSLQQGEGRPLRQRCRPAAGARRGGVAGGKGGRGGADFFFSPLPFFTPLFLFFFCPVPCGRWGRGLCRRGCGRRGGQRLPAPARCHLLQPPSGRGEVGSSCN